ncbi:hypothetical protein A9P82_05940 [Arachidicoccus ginsenosidimutans]|uniref:lipopolysaccharide biosynthesis protein n=1 Tax=Arachidicoccus sp. BS20 TaxID=1850526 RepID=UPI0007F051F9|nr:oligosaccharide flippase family protein [Arachidicoccus sp. BS20]ANI88872.1 hypothetical protein A9P82_05940 [Arachidicoccus sp. BS20]
MSTSKTIAKNTLFLYIRMLLTMGVGLYTSRVVLNVLGVSDFGIYSVVGGVVSLFAFFNAAMSSANLRFFAIDIGKKDWNNLHKTFNSSLIIHVGIAFVVLVIAETIGLWFVNYKLVLPTGRLKEANFVFQFSILSSIISITQDPFNALIIARERMNVFAAISIIEVILELVSVFLLRISPFDKLESYSVLLLVVMLIISSIYKIYCLKNFKESKFKYFRDKELYKKLVSYSGWTLFGNIAFVAKGQGINILLNIFFGTVVNAAYGIMLQVQNATNTFALNFQTAINPQIYKSYAHDNFIQLYKLIFQGSKFSFFVIFILLCPIVYNIHFILLWWLKTPPLYSDIFIIFALVNLSIECISRPLITGALATGKIKWYQIVVGGILLLNIPLTYILFRVISRPILFLFVTIFLSLITLIFRLFFLKKLITLNVKSFVREVIYPILLVVVISGLFLYGLDFILGKSTNFISLVLTSIFIVIITGSIIFFVGVKKNEKFMIYGIIKNKLRK